jgi:hypothetical protein
MSVGQTLYVSGGGYFEVTAKASATSITVKNLYATPTNVAVGTTVTASNTISAAGVKGDTGSTGTSGSSLVTLAKGGLATYSTQNIALSVGANNKFLGANSSAATGLEWDTVQYSDLGGTLALNTVTTSGQLPLAGIANAGGAAGDIAYWNGSAWVKLAKGATGQRLEQGGSNAPQWATVTASDVNMEAMGRVIYTTSGSPSVAYSGTPTNCAGVPTLSTHVVTVNFTTSITSSFPKAILTPNDANGVGLYVASITTSAMTVQLPATATTKEFTFAIFA